MLKVRICFIKFFRLSEKKGSSLLQLRIQFLEKMLNLIVLVCFAFMFL